MEALDMTDFTAWVAGKLSEVRYAPSLQQNVAALASRANIAEGRLGQVLRLHHVDDLGYSTCAHCHRRWPCPTVRLATGEA